MLWRAADGVRLHTMQAPSYVSAVAFTPDGSSLAASSIEVDSDFENNVVSIWKVADGTLLQILRGFKDDVVWLTYLKDGTLVTAANDELKTWSPGSTVSLSKQ